MPSKSVSDLDPISIQIQASIWRILKRLQLKWDLLKTSFLYSGYACLRSTGPLFFITVGILMQFGEAGPEKDVRNSRGFAIAEFVISVFFNIE